MNGWVDTLLDAALFGGVFVIAVWGICFACRRLPAWVRAWLWWIAGAQFLARLFLTLPIFVTVPAAAPPVSTAAVGEGSVKVISAPPSVAPITQTVSTEQVLFWLWLAGMAVGLVHVARRVIAARRLLGTATVLHDGPVASLLTQLLRRGENRPGLLESPFVKCPLLAGLIRPAIVVPVGYADVHESDEMKMALAHELAHIRRRDHWLSIVVVAVQTVFFFHPLAWLAAREAAIAREEACDLDVLRECGVPPVAYAQFLLKSVQARTPVAALGAAYGYRNLKRRITMLKNTSTSPLRRSWLFALAATVVAALPWSVVAQQAPQRDTKVASVAAPAKKAQATKKPVKKSSAKPSQRTTPVVAPAVERVQATESTAPARAVSTVAIPARSATAPVVQPPLERAQPAMGSHIPPASVEGVVVATSSTTPIREASAPTTRQIGGGEVQVKMADPADTGLFGKVSLKVERAEVEEALIRLLEASGANYVIKAKIKPELISCGFGNTTVMQALDAILRGIDQPLTYRQEGDVIFIIEKGS